MANTIRIKRRASGGAVGAPTSLQNAELAFNEADNTLYYGWGSGGAGGTATTIMAIAGAGGFVDLTSTQTIQGAKTFTSLISGSISGNAGTATTLATARTLGATGDVTGTSGAFNGSSNFSIALTLSNTGVAANSYGSATVVPTFTVDAKGRLTAAGTAAIAFPVTTVNGQTGAVTLTTANVAESGNLYYTDARVRANRIDQLAAPTVDVAWNSRRITNLLDPAAAQDAATKSYVDAVAAGAGNAPFESVKAVATTNQTLTGLTPAIDGVTLTAGARVLLTAQTTGTQNGIYVVAAGAWVRAADADATAEMMPGKQVFVNEGTTYGDSVWAITNDAPVVIGTGTATFTQISGLGQIVAGSGLSKTGNTLDVVAGTGISVSASNVGLTGQALALHNLATNGFFVRTAANTVAARTITAPGAGISVTNGDGVAGNPAIALTAPLAAIGGLTGAANTLAYFTSASAAATTSLTAFGRTLIGTADAPAARSALLLGTIATQNSNAVAITGGSITNLTTFDDNTIDCGTF